MWSEFCCATLYTFCIFSDAAAEELYAYPPATLAKFFSLYKIQLLYFLYNQVKIYGHYAKQKQTALMEKRACTTSEQFTDTQ